MSMTSSEPDPVHGKAADALARWCGASSSEAVQLVNRLAAAADDYETARLWRLKLLRDGRAMQPPIPYDVLAAAAGMPVTSCRRALGATRGR